MKYFIRDTADYRKIAHIADEGTIWTSRPRAICGAYVSPKKWAIVDKLGEYKICCIRCNWYLNRGKER